VRLAFVEVREDDVFEAAASEQSSVFREYDSISSVATGPLRSFDFIGRAMQIRCAGHDLQSMR
jgi:hypothetical protein